jgi:hypothetical protein
LKLTIAGETEKIAIVLSIMLAISLMVNSLLTCCICRAEPGKCTRRLRGLFGSVGGQVPPRVAVDYPAEGTSQKEGSADHIYEPPPSGSDWTSSVFTENEFDEDLR